MPDTLEKRWRPVEVVQRAQAQDLPLRIILAELWRRVLAWVDRRKGFR